MGAQAVLGIIGGLSPYSTILYYKEIVEEYRRRTGRDPELLLYSLSIDRVSSLVRGGDLEGLASTIRRAAEALTGAGATLLLVAANTPHIALPLLPEGLRDRFIPVLEAVWREVEALGASRVGLLATGATIRYRLYHEYFEPRGVEVIVPPEREQRVVDETIRQLTRGLIDPSARLRLSPVIMGLVARGAQAIILGCTELPLILGEGHVRSRIPLVDSARAHARLAVERLLQGHG